MVHIDEEALRSSLQRLRDAASDADVVDVMRRTVNSVHDVFGYGGAGIMFITRVWVSGLCRVLRRGGPAIGGGAGGGGPGAVL